MGLALGGRDFSTSAFRRRRQNGCSMRCAASSAAGSTLPQRGARLFIYYKFRHGNPSTVVGRAFCMPGSLPIPSTPLDVRLILDGGLLTANTVPC